MKKMLLFLLVLVFGFAFTVPAFARDIRECPHCHDKYMRGDGINYICTHCASDFWYSKDEDYMYPIAVTHQPDENGLCRFCGCPCPHDTPEESYDTFVLPGTAETGAAVIEDDRAAKLKTVFEEATSGLIGANYEMLALAGEVSYGWTTENEPSVLYGFLSRVTAVTPEAKAQFGMVLASEVPGAGVQLNTVETWPLTDENSGAAMPDAGYITDVLLVPVAELPEGTAGVSLEQAAQVANLWMACARFDFTVLDREAVTDVLDEAFSKVDGQVRTRYESNAPAFFAEARRLLDPREEAGALYNDVGISEALAILRGEERICASLGCLLDMLAPKN